jgi:hypothetical protein
MSALKKNAAETDKITPKTTTAVEEMPNLPKADGITAALMLIAAVVSGYLSYAGATEIFGDPLTALGFTVVVQGVVSLSLWYLAVARTLQRMLLISAWMIAVSFSIGTAFVKADSENDDKKIANAVVELSDYEAAVRGVIHGTHREAETWREKITAEKRRGGCGPQCRKLEDEATETFAAEVFYISTVVPALDNAAAARLALRDPELEDVLKIYQTLKNGIGALAEDVPAPSFIDKTARGVFDRIADAYDGLFGEDGHLSIETLGAVWVACLMEILAVACALIRMSTRMRPSDRPMERRAEEGLAWFYDLKTLPGRVKKLADRRAQRWTNEHAPARPQAGQTFSKPSGGVPSVMKSDQDYWLEGLHMQAVTSKTDLAELVLLLVEAYGTVIPAAPIDGEVFDKHKMVRTALIRTNVISLAKGGHAVTEKWGDWISFLFGQSQLLRTQKPVVVKERLRTVA